jgi:hypothetical protein
MKYPVESVWVPENYHGLCHKVGSANKAQLKRGVSIRLLGRTAGKKEETKHSQEKEDSKMFFFEKYLKCSLDPHFNVFSFKVYRI